MVFLLPTNGAQSRVILMAVLLGLALPLSPVQILWVNLVTAVTLSLTLAGEPAEPGIVQRPPRSPKEQVLSGRMIVLVIIASLLIGGVTLAVFLSERNLGATHAQVQTAAVTMLALAQPAFLFNARFLNSSSLTPRVLTGNRAIWIGAGILLVLQIAFVYAPFMNAWFDSAPIGLRGWGISLGLAILVFLLTRAGKALVRRRV
ncbi:MAG TPA: cation transporting ATPase C-terminal domain-containing protein [Nakamurella sp.]